MSKLTALIIAIALSVITIIADYFVKKASDQSFSLNIYLFCGAIIYGLTAIGWVYVMRVMKLSTVGVIYGVSCITLLALMSLFVFHEKITHIEFLGIILGISSIVLLHKFA